MPGPAVAAIGAGLGSSLIGARASGKAADAQSDAAMAALGLQREMYDRQDQLAKVAKQKNLKTIKGNRSTLLKGAAAEQGRLDNLDRGQMLRGVDLANTAYSRNKNTLTNARDDVLGGIARDRLGTSEKLALTRDKQLQGYNNAETKNLTTLKNVRDNSLGYFQPGYEMGNNALSAYGYNLGLGGKPKGYTGMELTPGAQFLLNEGRTQIEGGAAGQGGLYSGATLAALEAKRAGTVALDRDTQMAQLNNLIGVGQNAAGSMAGIQQNYGSGVTAARNTGAAARGNVWGDYGDDSTNNTRYWQGAEADATGRYAGALAGLEDQNYSRRAGINDQYYDSLGRNQVNLTDRRTNAFNDYANGVVNNRNTRAGIGVQAAGNMAANGSNALANYGNAQATGAINTANAINGGISNGLGVYGMLGGTFGNPFGGTQTLGSTQWPLNKPPMARPA